MDNLNLPSVMLALALLAIIGLRIAKHYRPPDRDETRIMYRSLEISMWLMLLFMIPLTLYALWRR